MTASKYIGHLDILNKIVLVIERLRLGGYDNEVFRLSILGCLALEFLGMIGSDPSVIGRLVG